MPSPWPLHHRLMSLSVMLCRHCHQRFPERIAKSVAFYRTSAIFYFAWCCAFFWKLMQNSSPPLPNRRGLETWGIFHLCSNTFQTCSVLLCRALCECVVQLFGDGSGRIFHDLLFLKVTFRGLQFNHVVRPSNYSILIIILRAVLIGLEFELNGAS